MKALLIAALAIVGTSAAYADGAAGTLPVNTPVMSQAGIIPVANTVAIAGTPSKASAPSAEHGCDFNTVSMRANNQVWLCNRYGNWVPIADLAASIEHAIPTSQKKCSISGVAITGNADVRCAG